MLRSALAFMHATRCDRMLAPWTRGVGAIFMLHHVTPDPVPEFSPNRILSVTPNFLESVIEHVRSAGFDVVSLDTAAERLRHPDPSARPFACFTFDDGYGDNVEHAYPVLKRHQVPFTVYVAPDFLDGHGELWWLALEEAIRRSPRLALPAALAHTPGETLENVTSYQKIAAFERIYWPIRAMPEMAARRLVAELCEACSYDPFEPCRRLVMSWDELRQLAADPLVTIGAHTLSHLALGKLPEAEARHQMVGSIHRVEQELGRPCRHFCYPYGDPASAGEREFQLAAELGMVTAVTTGKGLICACHVDEITALPRVSLNGDFQDLRYIEVLLSGVPFAVYNAAGKARDLVARGRRAGGGMLAMCSLRR